MIKPGRFTQERAVGKYFVRFDGGKVTAISFDLGPREQYLKIGGTAFATRSAEAIARRVAGCGPMQHNRGGSNIQCTSGLSVTRHMGGVSVTVQAPATGPHSA